MIDASYLVEPTEGLWLLSIDANVFEPINGDRDPRAEASYFDSTDAGWTAMGRHKPFIFDWIGDVTRRAEQEGKQLLAFSHYPIVDPSDGSLDDERLLFGNTSTVRRAPDRSVAARTAAAGLKVHFSGHLHINGTTAFRRDEHFLVNVSVPSIAAYPPAYKLVAFDGGRMRVETVRVGDVPGFDAGFVGYGRETAMTGGDPDRLLEAGDYRVFLDRHLAGNVRRRHLPLEWPAELASMVEKMKLGDLAAIATVPNGERDNWKMVAFLDLVLDWYRLRKGRGLAFDDIPPERLAAYRRLADHFMATPTDRAPIATQVAAFLRMLTSYLSGPPSTNFVIDLATGDIASGPPSARTHRGPPHRIGRKHDWLLCTNCDVRSIDEVGRLLGDGVDRLAERRQAIGIPACLRDIVKANHANVLRDGHGEGVAGSIHETEGEQVSDAKNSVRPAGVAKEAKGRIATGRIGSRPGADDGDVESAGTGGVGEGRLAGGEARRSCLRGNDREGLAAGAAEHG